jgi:hypothetical protein
MITRKSGVPRNSTDEFQKAQDSASEAISRHIRTYAPGSCSYVHLDVYSYMLKSWIKENPDEVFDTHEQRIYAFRDWIDSLEKYYPSFYIGTSQYAE